MESSFSSYGFGFNAIYCIYLGQIPYFLFPPLSCSFLNIWYVLRYGYVSDTSTWNKIKVGSTEIFSTHFCIFIRAIAGYLSCDLPYKLSCDDVFITSGCTQAIDVALAMLARPGANVLIPRPGFPIYELCATFRRLEIRYYDLLPENGWEVDLDSVEALADQNTVGFVIINPGNPCGNVYSYQHLKKVGMHQ